MTAHPLHRNHIPSRQFCRSGTAALEFVIVLPVLMVIVIGATDLSRVLNSRNIISNAARAGATYGATHQVTDFIYSSWELVVIERTVEEASNIPRFDPDQLQVTVTTFDEPDGSKRVHVDVSYPFELLIDWPGWPRQLTLQHGVSMRSYR